jgi:hypothetical protein
LSEGRPNDAYASRAAAGLSRPAQDLCYLVQILLPTGYNDGTPIADEAIEAVKDQLVSQFGGVTAFTRSPAKGVWAPQGGTEVHDDVVVVEVMTDALDESWWREFREQLERNLKQQSIVVRAQLFRSL